MHYHWIYLVCISEESVSSLSLLHASFKIFQSDVQMLSQVSLECHWTKKNLIIFIVVTLLFYYKAGSVFVLDIHSPAQHQQHFLLCK